jgi:3-oxoacyl-(acyl-carrier-protein) synthase
VVEAVVCVCALEAGRWPPTAGLRVMDPSIPLDVVAAEPRPLTRPIALKTASGFSGINSALVLCGPR